MEIRVTPRQVDLFRAPKRTLGDLDADAASKLITAAADIALVVDARGVVKDVSFGSEELARESFAEWIGQRWVDTVTVESREKIEELLRDAGAKSIPRWRQVNHRVGRGPDVPIRYTAVQVASNGRIVVVGRDLRSVAALQQRLVDVQQSVEQEYARLRHAETRYRMLFQITSEAVLVIDAISLRILEANPAASQLLGKPVKKLPSRSFAELFSDDVQKKLQAQLASARTTGRVEQMRVKLADSKLELVLSASLYRQENASHFLVQLAPANAGASAWLRSKSNVLDVVQKIPDGFVITDPDGKILTANAAFLEFAQAASEEQVREEPLDKWLGRHAVDLSVLIKNLRERGEIRNFGTAVRGSFGSTIEVEVSAVTATSGEVPCFGFSIRDVGRRPETAINGRRSIPRSVEQLTELVGRVPLKDLVRESTDMIERLCIEAALELTDDNRASAAEILGLSRQGLYSKLRRHGLGDLDSETEE